MNLVTALHWYSRQAHSFQASSRDCVICSCTSISASYCDHNFVFLAHRQQQNWVPRLALNNSTTAGLWANEKLLSGVWSLLEYTRVTSWGNLRNLTLPQSLPIYSLRAFKSGRIPYETIPLCSFVPALRYFVLLSNPSSRQLRSGSKSHLPRRSMK